jgi:hypothetical protein
VSWYGELIGRVPKAATGGVRSKGEQSGEQVESRGSRLNNVSTLFRLVMLVMSGALWTLFTFSRGKVTVNAY